MQERILEGTHNGNRVLLRYQLGKGTLQQSSQLNDINVQKLK
jgi:hypothetical protein